MKRSLSGWLNPSPPLLLILGVLLLGGCAKNARQYRTADQVQNAPFQSAEKAGQTGTALAKTEPGAALAIDTNTYNLETRLAFLVIKQRYYNQKVRDKVRQYYSHTNYQTRWLHQHAPNPLYYSFTDMIKNSSRYGLDPGEYALEQLEERVAALYATQPVSVTDACNLDVQLTSVFFLFTTHVLEGRLTDAGYGKDIWIREYPGKEQTDIAMLAGLCTTGNCEEALQSIHPAHEQYIRLQGALSQYRELEKQDPAPTAIASAEPIKPGMTNNAIPAIRRKLTLTDLPMAQATHDSVANIITDSLYYDDVLVSAVKWFQYRHGLEPDGVIGKGTLKFLNQSFREKADLIALNLERLRWQPANISRHTIVVNIPEYKMRLYDNHKEALSMRVIVGAQSTSTPIFTDTLRYLVFGPTWNVPVSIIKNEVIPHLKRDSAYYSNKSYRFYKGGVEIDPAAEDWSGPINPNQYTVIQQPGSDNALGKVKFVMPNNMNIYMHDTPNHRLFTKSYRAISHGCVRLDEPALLAEYLLRDQNGWTSERIQKAMAAEQPQTIILKKPYRIQLEYRTAWVDENGLVNFREDIYGHDRRQLARLQTRTPLVISEPIALEMP